MLFEKDLRCSNKYHNADPNQNLLYSTNQIQVMHDSMKDLLFALGVNNIRANFCCLCPAHDDRNPSMSYWEQAGLVHCFSCGVTADAIDVAGWVSGETTFPKKVQALEAILGTNFGNPTESSRYRFPSAAEKRRIARPVPEKIKGENVVGNVFRACESVFKMQGEHAKSYFYNRGFGDEDIKVNCLGWCLHPSEICAGWTAFPYGEDGYCVIPYFESKDNSMNGVVRTCTFRPLFSAKAKEYNVKGHPAVIYREYLLCHPSESEIYITEGAFDAISLERIADVSTCALGGASGVNRLLSVVENTASEKRPHLAIQLDADASGDRLTRTLAKGLDDIGATYRIAAPLPGVKDPNEYLQLLKERGDDNVIN